MHLRFQGTSSHFLTLPLRSATQDLHALWKYLPLSLLFAFFLGLSHSKSVFFDTSKGFHEWPFSPASLTPTHIKNIASSLFFTILRDFHIVTLLFFQVMFRHLLSLHKDKTFLSSYSKDLTWLFSYFCSIKKMSSRHVSTHCKSKVFNISKGFHVVGQFSSI